MGGLYGRLGGLKVRVGGCVFDGWREGWIGSVD